MNDKHAHRFQLKGIYLKSGINSGKILFIDTIIVYLQSLLTTKEKISDNILRGGAVGSSLGS